MLSSMNPNHLESERVWMLVDGRGVRSDSNCSQTFSIECEDFFTWLKKLCHLFELFSQRGHGPTLGCCVFITYFFIVYCLFFIVYEFIYYYSTFVTRIFFKMFFFSWKTKKTVNKDQKKAEKNSRPPFFLYSRRYNYSDACARWHKTTGSYACVCVCLWVGRVRGEGRGGGVDALGDNSRGWSPAVSTMCRWLPYSCSYEVQTKATW